MLITGVATPEMRKNMNRDTETSAALIKAQERLSKLGFKSERRLGLNPLSINEGETVFVEITGPISDYLAKSGETYQYVKVTNLENGEADMHFWLSGQIRHQLEALGSYEGKKFMITHKGQVQIDGKNINQFDISVIN